MSAFLAMSLECPRCGHRYREGRWEHFGMGRIPCPGGELQESVRAEISDDTNTNPTVINGQIIFDVP